MEKIKNVSLSLSESFQPSDIYLIPEYLQLQGLSTEDGTDRQCFCFSDLFVLENTDTTIRVLSEVFSVSDSVLCKVEAFLLSAFKVTGHGSISVLDM